MKLIYLHLFDVVVWDPWDLPIQKSTICSEEWMQRIIDMNQGKIKRKIIPRAKHNVQFQTEFYSVQ